jgi:hypothetical protein
LGEKWFRDQNHQWYFVTPAGKIYKWNGQSNLSTSPIFAIVAVSVYNDPTLLFNA